MAHNVAARFPRTDSCACTFLDINAPGVNNVFTKEELEILERNENPAGPLGEKVHLFKIRLNDTFESLSSPANNFITLVRLSSNLKPLTPVWDSF